MHYVALVPLGAAVAFSLIKGFVIVGLIFLALFIWMLYEFYLILTGKDKKKKKKDEDRIWYLYEKNDPDEEDDHDEEMAYWDRMMREQQEQDAEFFKKIGRLEQKLDDLEEYAGTTKKRRSRKRK